MAFAFVPAGANSLNVAYGVDDTLTNYIVQNENITNALENLTIQDQKGRVCQVIAYDKGSNLSLTLIGSSTAPCAVGDQLTISAGTITVTAVASGGSATGGYVVQSVDRACTYGDTAKWNITATGWEHATYKNKMNDNI